MPEPKQMEGLGTPECVKIRFRIDKDEDGFPPIDIEPLSADRLPNGHFQICSSPFFVRGIAYGDIVSAVATGDPGWFDFIDVTAQSGRLALCVIVFKDVVTIRRSLLASLRQSSFYFEDQALSGLLLIAISGFPGNEWDALNAMLVEMLSADQISFAELKL
ncbi:MAG: DUF4265 domain-containing protein [Hyphomicrobiaceae bacterium]